MHYSSSTKTAGLKLEKGRKYALKLEYYQTTGDAVARLVWTSEVGSEPVADAVRAAKDADVVVAMVGITADLEGEEMKVDIEGFKGGDRTSIDLPKQEAQLLEAVSKTGKPLIVVLMNGSALAVNWADQHANAILESWYSGEEGGTAIAETLAGVNNPAGRLPVTFYTGLDALPNFEDYSMKNRTYRYFEGKPLYPFGHGLSYSKFEYRNVKLSSPCVKAGDALTLEADVRNASKRDGDEVVQVYLNFPKLPGAPNRALRAFRRVHLAAGGQQHMRFDLSARDLSMVNSHGDRMMAAGAYTLSIGGGQPGTGAVVSEPRFTIAGDLKLPE